MNILQDLYNSEINFSIIAFYDGGFNVKLGDSVNGYVTQAVCNNMKEVVKFLKGSAIINFPDSEFSKKHGKK